MSDYRADIAMESAAITRGLHHDVDMAVCQALGCKGIAKYKPEITVYHDFEAELTMEGTRQSTHEDALKVVNHLRGGKPYQSPLEYLRFVAEEDGRTRWQVSSAFRPENWGGTGDDLAA